MRKRILAMALAVLVSVSAFCMPVFADQLVMSNVVHEELLPLGYLSPSVTSFFYRQRDNEILVYASRFDMYLLIGFNGMVEIRPSNISSTLFFSDPDSLQVRAYPCNGRDVFTLMDDVTFEINIPAIDFMELTIGEQSISGVSWPKITGIWEEYMVQIFDQDGRFTGWYDVWIPGFDHTFKISEQQLTLTMQELNMPITISDLASQHLDYYVVQKQGSSVSTSIDYKYKWDHTSDNGFRLNYSNVLCVPVTARFDYWGTTLSSAPIRYSLGSYYYGRAQDRYIVLRDMEKLDGQHWFNQLNVAYLNRYLSHFGYETVYYSSSGSQLSGDIADAGDVIGGYGDAAGSYEDYAAGNVTDLTTAIASAQPIFIGVWNVLPSWFWMLLGVSLTIVIGRKVIGR